jgi:hypothetical protein
VLTIPEAGTYQSPGIDIVSRILIVGTISSERPTKFLGYFFCSVIAALRLSLAKESDIEEHACFHTMVSVGSDFSIG